MLRCVQNGVHSPSCAVAVSGPRVFAFVPLAHASPWLNHPNSAPTLRHPLRRRPCPGVQVVRSVVKPARLARLDIVKAGDDVERKKPDPMIYNLARQLLAGAALPHPSAWGGGLWIPGDQERKAVPRGDGGKSTPHPGGYVCFRSAPVNSSQRGNLTLHASEVNKSSICVLRSLLL